jgi:nitrite reductase/ring-hydroxylating ferredoxin subunit
MPEDFVKVAQVGDIAPGKCKPVRVGNEEILLSNVNGTIHAISDICSHAYAALSEGDLSGEEIECPLHGSAFNVISGECQNPPANENVPVYPVRIDGDDVLVGPA